MWVDFGGDERYEDDELPTSFGGATNNQMELQAAVEVLKRVIAGRVPADMGDFRRVVIHSDSRYVTENVGSAIYSWPGQKWMTRTGSPVLNAAQWKELVRLMQRLDKERGIWVRFEWVKGKSDSHTKRVDKLAMNQAG